MRPLILTGGPAAGKSTCARALASGRDRAACIEVDDLRRLIVTGDVPLWQPGGEVTARLSARNAASLARSLLAAGFDVVLTDVVTPAALPVYRDELPGCLVVHLHLPVADARERASTRPVHLTDDEFDLVHAMVATPPEVDVVLDVAGLSVAEQVEAIRTHWV